MSKTIKSLMIKVTLAILMLAMVGFVFTTVNFRSAKAEETATGVFEFVGTSINVEDVTDGEAGYEDVTSAKITSIVDKTYYDAIEVKEGETLKFFTLVSTSDEDPTLEKVEGSENRIVVAYWYPDFTETRTEFTSNTYIANFPAERYASEFTVRVGYTVGETTEYVDSVKTSLVGVASQAINAGYTEDLSKYLGEAKTLVG
ncbi:MAG: hypothetical protein IJV99_03985, partial [Clostridia bacterium]|nr:hypothetical protein [Clostridia bacterium]